MFNRITIYIFLTIIDEYISFIFQNNIQRKLMGKGDIPKTKIHKLVVNPAIKASIFFAVLPKCTTVTIIFLPFFVQSGF